MGTTYNAEKRDYRNETRENLEAQIDLMPRLFGAEKEWGQRFAQNKMDIHKQMAPQIMGMMEQLQPRLAAMDRQTLQAQREADIGAMEQLGPRAMAAMRGIDPSKTELMDSLTEQAQQGVDAGGQLTSMEQRRFQQNVRGSQAARGMGMGPSDALYESAELQLAGERRQQQRTGEGYRAIGMRQGMMGDPFMQILGKPSGINPMMAMQAAGQGRGYSPGALFNPESNYAANIYSGNQQAINMQRMSQMQGQNALMGAGIGALGSMGGGWLEGRG